jgi:hypothetical protein
MGTIEKVAMGIVAIAFVTTLILPDRQTAAVVKAGGSVFTNGIQAAMGKSVPTG